MLTNSFRPGGRPLWFVLVTVVLVVMDFTVARAVAYQDNRSLAKQLMSLAEQNPDIVRVTNIARSMGKRKVWLVEVGKGTEQDRRTRPV